MTNTRVPGEMSSATQVSIGGTEYTLVTDEDYNLYYLDGSYDPVLIGALEGRPTIIPFSGYAVILDGGT